MASRGINKVIIIGNLGNDPELRYMPNGTAVVSISVATSESWTDQQSGQLQERTEWHRCEAFGKLAEIIGQYLRKGSKIYVEGSLRTDKWQDQSGQDRYSTKVRINNMQMLDSKGGNAGDQSFTPAGAPAQRSNQNQNQQAAPSAAPKHGSQDNFKAPNMMDDDFDDDIPF